MNNITKIHALYGLKWNQFSSAVPSEAFVTDEPTKRFFW